MKSKSWWDVPLAAAALATVSSLALGFVHERGFTLYYGDAMSHVNHARRLLDSRTPGPEQLGTVWLPLPHLLAAPLAADDYFWRTGLAGAIPSAACYTLAGIFLYAAVRRILDSRAAAFAAAACFALNPNLLYLQSTPMTEAVFFAALTGVLYFTVLFRDTQSILAAIAAALAVLAATQTRYEGWLLAPVVPLYFLIAARRRRFAIAFVVASIAAAGPLSWLAHNWWHMGDPLTFYRGPHSPRAIQGAAGYPGFHDWPQAWKQFRAAAALAAGWPLLAIAAAGAAAALLRRALWPLLLLAIPPLAILASVHSGGTPIRVPDQWPSYYNTRYGLALLPLAAFAAAAIVAWIPARFRTIAALAIAVASLAPWLADPRLDNVVTWKESEVNSAARREYTRRLAAFLRDRRPEGAGIFTTFGDLTGAFQEAGIPLRDTLTWDNPLLWHAAAARPDLFLREPWAVAIGGDPVQSAINRAALRGPRYTLQKMIVVKGAPVIEIYRRDSLRGLLGNP